MAFISSDKARRYIRSLPVSPRVDFAKLYPDADPSAIDLIDKMLAFDPSNRITVEEALSHPYLASLHDVDDEPSASEPFAFGARSRLFPIRPHRRGERRSLRTLPGASLRPGSLAFNPRPRCLSTPLLTPLNSTPTSLRMERP